MSTFFGRLAERVQGGGSQIKPLTATPFSPSSFTSPRERNRELTETGTTTPTANCDVGTHWQRRMAEGREQPQEHAASHDESFLSGWTQERATQDHEADFESEIGKVGSRTEVTRRSAQFVRETPIAPKAMERSSDEFFPATEAHTWIVPTVPAAANKRMQDSHNNAASDADSLPIVQVTIGRIEVRSAAGKNEPERIERRGTRTPRVTLEEYLRRRNEGRR